MDTNTNIKRRGGRRRLEDIIKNIADRNTLDDAPPKDQHSDPTLAQQPDDTGRPKKRRLSRFCLHLALWKDRRRNDGVKIETPKSRSTGDHYRGPVDDRGIERKDDVPKFILANGTDDSTDDSKDRAQASEDLSVLEQSSSLSSAMTIPFGLTGAAGVDKALDQSSAEPVKCVYRAADRQIAIEFARDIMVSSSLPSSKYRVYWSDASCRRGRGAGHYGGIAVAERHGTSWLCHPSCVSGIRSVLLLEALAVHAGLEVALRDPSLLNGSRVIVFTDNDASLRLIESFLQLCSAVKSAAYKYATTGDHSHTLNSFIQARGFKKIEQFPVKGFPRMIFTKVMAAYLKLVSLGATVEFRVSIFDPRVAHVAGAR